jgi:hypothetical protein
MEDPRAWMHPDPQRKRHYCLWCNKKMIVESHDNNFCSESCKDKYNDTFEDSSKQEALQ